MCLVTYELMLGFEGPSSFYNTMLLYLGIVHLSNFAFGKSQDILFSLPFWSCGYLVETSKLIIHN